MKFKEGIKRIDKFNLLERWIIVHSILYYHYDKIIVDDKIFDNNCRLLRKASKKFPKTFSKSKWFYIFKDLEDGGYFSITPSLIKKDKKYFKRIIGDVIKYAR